MFFEEFMKRAVDESKDYGDIEDDDQDQKFKWVYDSMRELLLAILRGDTTMSDKAREALMNDINEFEIANGLNQRANSEDRAAAICEKSSVLTRELVGWMSSITKGIKAAFGSSLFSFFGKAFDKLAEKIPPSVKKIGLLKGINTVSAVSSNPS